MKLFAASILLFSVVSLQFAYAQADTIRPQLDTFVVPNNAFMVGEKLVYTAKYGFIEGGRAHLSINLIPHGYSYVYHSKAYAETSGVADKLTTVRDVYESYFDVETGLPIMAIRNIHENNYRRYNEVRFNRNKNTVLSLKSGLHIVPENVLDVLSAYYFARTYLFKNLSKNQVIVMQTFFDDELFPIEIKFKGHEKIKTNFGKIECLTFGPVTNENSPFTDKEDLRIWFTDDGNFVPIKVRIKVPVGSIKLDLIDFEGLKNDFQPTNKLKKKKKQ